MFKTLKFKIIFIISLLLFILSIVTFAIALSAYENGKQVKIEAYDVKVDKFTYHIDTVIYDLKVIVSELASGGSLYAEYKGDSARLNSYVESVFQNNKSNLKKDEIFSGGIWFEPYKINPLDSRLGVFYKNGEIYSNKALDELNYDYQNESWYKILLKNISVKDDLAWVVPYIDSNLTDRLMTTIGKAIYDEKGKIIGIATIDWDLESIVNKLQSRKTPKNSIILFADKKDDVILYYQDSKIEKKELIGQSLEKISWYSDGLKENTGLVCLIV